MKIETAGMKFISDLKKMLQFGGSTASVPEGLTAYAIGDIHGRIDLLDDLLKQIENDAAEQASTRRILIFLGDYVDRGWKSKQVLDRLCGLEMEGFELIFLKGNHEEALLSFLDDALFLDSWRQYGGLETLHAYGLKDLNFQADADYMRRVRAEFGTALPDRHKEFLRDLLNSFELGDYFFAHAGVRPGVALDQQRPKDLLWIRDEFLNSQLDFGRRVVHGHCPAETPQVRVNRIGVDTGAYITGCLTTVVLKGSDVRFLQTSD